MTAAYESILNRLRQAFPQPVSDRVHDAYFAFSFLRALDQVDRLKGDGPILGTPHEPDFVAAHAARIEDDPRALEEVSDLLVERLEGLLIWGHPRTQVNVVPPPTIAGIIGGVLPSIYNPNLVSEESGRSVAAAEVEVASMTAALCGYDPDLSAGLFTFGGSGTLLYGVRIGMEKAIPGIGRTGVRKPMALVCSEAAHYACRTVAAWLGIGEEHVVRVPADANSEIDVEGFEAACRKVLDEGIPIAGIIATLGTTDAFGIDDLQAMANIRKNLVTEYGLTYVPHIHADAVIGWAWAVFNDYDLDANPLQFRKRTIRAIAGARRRIMHLSEADTIGIDFHKTGFTPYVSSMILIKDRHDLERIGRSPESMPYLFQSGEYHPGYFTLETSRSGFGPMAALANLRLFGKQGLRTLLGHVITMAETLREHLEAHAAVTVMNRRCFGPVTLFRVYPDGVDTFSVPEKELTDPEFREQLLAHNDYNRRIFEIINREAMAGRGVALSMTERYRNTAYGEPVTALKSYILSPFAEEQYVGAVIESIQHARDELSHQTT